MRYNEVEFHGIIGGRISKEEAEFNEGPRDFSFFKITFYKKQGNLGVIGAKRCNCYNGRAESRGRTDGKSYP